MVNFFDSIEVAPGVYANGRMTLGENIADHGGLQVSYQAFKKATAANPRRCWTVLLPNNVSSWHTQVYGLMISVPKKC